MFRSSWILKLAFLGAAALLAGAGLWTQARAQTLVWPEIELQPVVSDLDRPLGIMHAGDGSGRLFIMEQAGVIHIFADGVLNSVPFLDITNRVSCCGERGLLGLAFPPDFETKGYFYVNYTDLDGDTVVGRYSVSADLDLADPDSEFQILTVEQPEANHNGGHMVFGPDGYLYIGLGDGGGGGDPLDRAQTPGDLLGKLLRIDTEGPGCTKSAADAPPFYCVPADNPFVSDQAYRPEIWALGLRNPWRFSFDRETGDLYTGDVGQGAREEINFQAADSPGGHNYGWNVLEGSLCYPSGSTTGCTPPPGYSAPVAEYSHTDGCSVTGGSVFRGPGSMALHGIYFYGDYCSGIIWGLRFTNRWEGAPLLDTTYQISSFGESEDGSLYLVDLIGGAVYQVSQGADTSPLPVRLYMPVMH